jgi:sugar lactone lactonase YvrE
MSSQVGFQLSSKEKLMSNVTVQKARIATQAKAKLATVASFPANYFLENLAVRSDNSAIVTALNRRELWYVPPAEATETVTPILLHTFEQLTLNSVEVEPDVFYLTTSNVYTDHRSSLHRIDLRHWHASASIQPQKVLDFPKEAVALNGSCLIDTRTILVADSGASLIWRVDLPKDGGTPVARVWLRHESMGNYPGQMKPEQPGVNGVRYAAKLGYVYYTSTAKKLFMRVQLNPQTLEAVGEPEHVSAGRMADDFCIDENAGVAYLTTHRENTIDCVSLNPARNSDRFIAAGDPLNEELIGPSSAVWGRLPGEYGKVAFVTTDGGTASPLPDGVRRPAKLLRVEFAEAPQVLRSQEP